MTQAPSNAADDFIKDWARIIWDATGDQTRVDRAIELAHLNGLFDHLAAVPPAQEVKPVAWLYEMAFYIKPSDGEPLRNWKQVVTIYPPPVIPKDGVRNISPLYATPPPSGDAVRREETSHLRTIAQRDEAEECVSDIYYKIIGRSPEWSNNFGFDEAREEIEDVISILKQAAHPLPPRGDAVREAGSRLIEVAAECHRAKWEFDLGEDYRPSAKAARALILKAFNELHRIGDIALKAAKASLPSSGADAGHAALQPDRDKT